ncbi:uncharacterized protein METZ01_LOCUS227386 [marine metagenome]|uniref:Uncharacterized protein n=1 Tax=marine metagenome TaxID=408172 RepID=A0A382GI37_9ZZZZ
MKKKKKKISIALKKGKLFVNNILFPNRAHTEKTIEEEMTKMFEDDRPKSME